MWISSYHVETVSGYGSVQVCQSVALWSSADCKHHHYAGMVQVSGPQWPSVAGHQDTRRRHAHHRQQPVPQEFVRLQTLARPGQCGTHGLISLCRNTVANSSDGPHLRVSGYKVHYIYILVMFLVFYARKIFYLNASRYNECNVHCTMR